MVDVDVSAVAGFRAGFLGELVHGDEHRGVRLRHQERVHVHRGAPVEQGTAGAFGPFFLSQVLFVCFGSVSLFSGLFVL